MSQKPRGIVRKLTAVLVEVNAEMAGLARAGEPCTRENLFARGLASEGYVGGYRDAISDVLQALNDVMPSRRGWWEKAYGKLLAKAIKHEQRRP